jgi:2-polyprenyl-3-methyl-5-hydroxy-6-metoxy-1,4-benzoquinol methylase
VKARRLGPFGLVELGIGAIVVGRRLRAHIAGHEVPGGILIANPGAYDAHSQRLLGSFFRGIASDIASAAASPAKVLEAGCGPEHLSIRLAREHALHVTGLDLIPP